LQYKTSLGRLFQMKDAEYEYVHLANSVFILGIVSISFVSFKMAKRLSII